MPEQDQQSSGSAEVPTAEAAPVITYCTFENPTVSQTFPTILGTTKHVDAFEKLNRIGEGTYGIVYKARDKSTNQIVALKRIRMEFVNEGLPISSLREISILKSLNHVNIVSVYDVVVGDLTGDIFLLMEFCEQDMATLMDNTLASSEELHVFDVPQAKCLVQQLLRGVSYMHDKYIMHRDLKLSNLLLTANGVLV